MCHAKLLAQFNSAHNQQSASGDQFAANGPCGPFPPLFRRNLQIGKVPLGTRSDP